MNKRKVVTRLHKEIDEHINNFHFTSDLIPESSEKIKSYRENAWNINNQLPLPSITEDAWRRTDLRFLKTSSFEMVSDLSTRDLVLEEPPDYLLKPLADDQHSAQIILTPKGLSREIDPDLLTRGVIFEDLSDAEREHPQLVEKIIGQIVRPEEGKFSSLASAFSKRGIFLYVPPGVHVHQPLHSVMWGPGAGLAYFSHVIVWLDENASATFIHEGASPVEIAEDSMHAGVVEIRVSKGANLRFVELQSWGQHMWNFTHERAQVERDGQIDWIFGALGSHLSKNFSDLDLIGRGANGRMSGFYFTDRNQHLDHDTQQNHLAPDTKSDLLFKGALRGNSRSVWQGMIFVAPGAQKADGYQANRNLMLSPDARADSIPGLEILADDVRCTHGATVGRIDQEQLFYLNSRGIPNKDAERLIVEGFFEPIMQRIPFEGVRDRFHSAIQKKLG